MGHKILLLVIVVIRIMAGGFHRFCRSVFDIFLITRKRFHGKGVVV